MVSWLVIVVIVVVVLFVVYLYNSLIRLRMRVNNAWAQIDVQLKRRYDLIPNLVNTVKGYVKHEKKVLEDVTKARALLVGGTMEEKATASKHVTEGLHSIFALAENYPQLKANENFKLLQEELSGTESKIAYARQFYNDAVMHYNESLQVFPKSIFARLFRFQPREFFQAESKEKKEINVEF